MPWRGRWKGSGVAVGGALVDAFQSSNLPILPPAMRQELWPLCATHYGHVAVEGGGEGGLARRSTIEKMGPPHRLDLRVVCNDAISVECFVGVN